MSRRASQDQSVKSGDGQSQLSDKKFVETIISFSKNMETEQISLEL